MNNLRERITGSIFNIVAELVIVILVISSFKAIMFAGIYLAAPERSPDRLWVVLQIFVSKFVQFWDLPQQMFMYPTPFNLAILYACSVGVRLKGKPRFWLVGIATVLYVSLFVYVFRRQLSINPASITVQICVLPLKWVAVCGLSLVILNFKDRVKSSIELLTDAPSLRESGRRRGFSLVEMLVVLTIIMILTSITASYIVSSKRQAKLARESSQIRNLYLAVGLYESDSDDKSPISLALLSPTYAPGSYLACPDDQRWKFPRSDWPANPWIMWSLQDDSVISRMRSQNMVSYFFMRSWQRAFPKGRTYEELRNDPEVGFIAGFGMFDCLGETGCIYPKGLGSYNEGHPASNIGGVMMEARTDGSIVTRHRNGNCRSGMLFAQAFLFGDLTCY